MGHPGIGGGSAEEREIFGGWRLGFDGFFARLDGDLFGDGAGVLEDGEGEAVGFACGGVDGAGFGEESSDLIVCRPGVVDDGSVIDSRGQVFEQGGEFELGEEFAAGGVVRRLGAHLVDAVVDRDARVDGDQLFREENIVAIIL